MSKVSPRVNGGQLLLILWYVVFFTGRVIENICTQRLYPYTKMIYVFEQEMEKLASRKLKINAKETMKIAEKLYTQGYISYPRTETNIFPKELDLVGLVSNQTQDQRWGGLYI